MLAPYIGLIVASSAMTQIWIRNPLTCIREVAELCVSEIVWDRGFAWKRRVDPQKHLELHLPRVIDYRILMVGDQGAAELRRGHSIRNPFAVYPVWEYGAQTIPQLERMMKEQVIPRGSDADERGVIGQEHRVVIIRPPDASTKLGTAFISTLAEMQSDYPSCIIHYHGTFSLRVAAGAGFASADFDPVADAAKGRIVLPNGRYIPYELASEYPAWCKVVGFAPSELEVARNRTMFNIKSAMWAGQNWDNPEDFRVRKVTSKLDYGETPVAAPTKKRANRTKYQPGDKFTCDTCSVSKTCRYFRDGGVCIISDSETSALARHFKTRDAQQIIDGVGKIVEKMIVRAERGMDEEVLDGKLDPEVTKILKHVADTGVKLAKLVDPNLAGGMKVGVFVNGQGAVSAATVTEGQLVAGIIAELESQGVAREDIDMDLVATYLASKNRVAIEATARD
jgi:hypothetical protein